MAKARRMEGEGKPNLGDEDPQETGWTHDGSDRCTRAREERREREGQLIEQSLGKDDGGKSGEKMWGRTDTLDTLGCRP